MSRNLYDILGLERDATSAEIKRAYRKASLRVHPDKVRSGTAASKEAAEKKFIEVRGAFEVLSDHEKRRHYDSSGRYDTNSDAGRHYEEEWEGYAEEEYEPPPAVYILPVI